MKKQIFLLFTCLVLFISAQAQDEWEDDGTNIRNTNSGNVGVGTALGANLTERLHVNGRVRADGLITGADGLTTQGPVNLLLGANGSPTFYLMASNGFLGLGAANPTQRLEVNGNVLSNQFISSTGTFNGLTNLSFQTNGTSRLFVQSTNGFVGIGTSTPTSNLHLSGGDFQIENGNMLLNNGATPTIYLGTGATELNRYLQIQNSSGLQTSSGLKAGGLLVADTYTYANPNKNDLVVKGRTYIGTNITNSTNNYTLAVNGTIGAKDLRIEKSSDAWPDYVFEDGYTLPTAAELEAYIKEHKHLEGIPSASEVNENGYSVNELDVALLKKVEELTLLIIQQQKEIDELKKGMQDAR